MNKISNNVFYKILDYMIELVKENKKIFVELNRKDNQIHKFDFDINKLIEIIKSYKTKEIKNSDNKLVCVNHYGNPYLTITLILETLLNNKNLILIVDNICYGINKGIEKIVNNSLKYYKVDLQVVLRNNINNEIKDLEANKIVCLGNYNSYDYFRKQKKFDVEYIPFFDLNLYYDCEEYEELAEIIRKYAFKNFYEIEVFDGNEEFDDVIFMIENSAPKYCSVILSKDELKQKRFKQEIGSQIICVNENPFKKFKLEIPKEIIC